MNTTQRRDALLEATEAEDGFLSLRNLVVQLADEGVTPETLMRDMAEIKALLSPPNEDIMMDVMDQVVGWCSPHVRIFPRPLPSDPDYGTR